MTVIDVCFFVLCGIFAFVGWRKGAVKVVLGPLVWFGCFYLGWKWFLRTGQWGWPVAIALIGPVFLLLLINYTVQILRRPEKADDKQSDTRKFLNSNRLIGMIIAVVWNGGLMVVMMIMFALAPLSMAGAVTQWQDAVRTSWIFQAFSGPLLKKMPALCFLSYQDTLTPDEIANNNNALFSSPEFKTLMEDDRLKSFYADEDIQEMIKEKDVSGLMTDKRVQDILADPEMLSKLWAFADKAAKQRTAPAE